MHKLLLPGTRIKRWILLFVLGCFSFILFIILAFGREINLFFSMVNEKVMEFLDVPVTQYPIKLTAEIILFIIAVVFIAIGLKQMMRFVMNVIIPEKKGKLAHLIYEKSALEEAPSVVVIGGGTGLNSILTGLKEYTNNITAIVTVFDAGGSSRMMRTEFGILPPGDVRNCLVALSDSGPLMAKLLEYRFKKGGDLKGHSFGNLLITALTKITGSFDKAVEETGKILAIRGKVVPVSSQKTHLAAVLENGQTIKEEPNIEEHKLKYGSEIKRMFLSKPAEASPDAIHAIRSADVIVLGPGSLYTSILPHLLVKGIVQSIKDSSANKVYICNVMTQPGETDNYTASDHVSKVIKYLGKDVLDYVVINTEQAPEELYSKYKKSGAQRVRFDEEKFEDFNVEIIKADLMTKKNLLRHDPKKLAKVVLKLVK